MMLISPMALSRHAALRDAGGYADGRSLQLDALQHSDLPALQALVTQALAPAEPPDLASDLYSGPRGAGRQVVVARSGGQILGCAAWVTFGIAEDGRLYGSPVVATDRHTAHALLAYLLDTASTLGASHLRVSTWAGESAKVAALQAAGFTQLFEWVNFARDTGDWVAPDWSDTGLHRLDLAQADWAQLTALHNAAFSGVPNAPPLDEATVQDDWQSADQQASAVLVDGAGHYVAYVLVTEEGDVDGVGVDASLRGRGLARRLYAHAAQALRARGLHQLTALVSSANAESMALHQRLGFHESTPRGAVYERATHAA
ncbi:GNAT family N-acetyltransferase [Chitinimonas sp. BJYL2]|uniref:GNAT family N-acetyltransferase n=1 Tax=Chitinimonas sp. BJYL2 TaxID=2976696 RepID=UPI0022B3AD2D|nr:GNAT family N-acetyltransferase [Chitinimonas sp. BJYL2]